VVGYNRRVAGGAVAPDMIPMEMGVDKNIGLAAAALFQYRLQVVGAHARIDNVMIPVAFDKMQV